MCQKGPKGGGCVPQTQLSLLCVPCPCLKISISLVSLLLLHYLSFCSRWAIVKHCVYLSAKRTILLRAAALAWWVRVLVSPITLFIRLTQKYLPSCGFVCPKGNFCPLRPPQYNKDLSWQCRTSFITCRPHSLPHYTQCWVKQQTWTD